MPWTFLSMKFFVLSGLELSLFLFKCWAPGRAMFRISPQPCGNPAGDQNGRRRRRRRKKCETKGEGVGKKSGMMNAAIKISAEVLRGSGRRDEEKEKKKTRTESAQRPRFQKGIFLQFKVQFEG